MTKKHIFKSAHKIAKGIVKEVGNYQIAFKLALKEVYRQVRLYDKKRFGINAIESAIYRLGTSQEDKEFDSNQRQSLVKLEDEKIVKETEKAYKIAFFTEYGLFEKWIPKSVFKMEHTNITFAY